MNPGWRVLRVEEIAGPQEHALATGPFGSSIASKFFVDSGVPVIRGSNLSEDVGHRLIENGLVFVSEEKAASFARSVVERGDLVFTCWGTIGQVGLIDERASFDRYVVSNKQMKLTPNPDIVDSLYLYYCFSGPEVSTSIRNRKIGSSVPGFNLSQLKATELLLPPLEEQRAIAGILGALDDKIALNREMNGTLEATAQAIFRSWFVDFDPVVAKADGRKPFGMSDDLASLFPDRFVESELGSIPEGWEVGKLGDVARQRRCGVHPQEVPPDTPYIGLEHMPQQQIALSEWGEAQEVSSNKSRFHEKNILFGKLRPYFHKVGVAFTDGICSTDILVIKENAPSWFGFALGHLSSADLVGYADATSSGTRQPRTNWRSLNRYQVCLPQLEVAAAYSALINPMVQMLRDNALEAQTLAALRDLLLPKLLSGEIRVAEAEERLEAAGA